MASAVVTDAAFQLPENHPGFADHEYRSRRAAIAKSAETFEDSTPIPLVEYTAEENDVWRIVSRELASRQAQFACQEYLAAAKRLTLPTDQVPQLRDVDRSLEELTKFRILPVPGLVPTRTFYGSLARRTFLSTQYVRHHSVPFYTPEPDIIHEVIGHAEMLASPSFARLYEAAGRASLRTKSEAAQDFFSRVFWFTLEFGVVYESGELKAYGAGLLSSYGEIAAFRDAEIRPFDIAAMGEMAYDITQYQPVLFAAESFSSLERDLSAFFESLTITRTRAIRGGTRDQSHDSRR